MKTSIQEMLNLYRQALVNKDSNTMLSLYCDDVLIYDVAGQWSLSGKQELQLLLNNRVSNQNKNLSLNVVGFFVLLLQTFSLWGII